ncbi:hypothetical protein J4H86_08830 [Spiractinospora alimapuensis]|uniref:hypothetical protein n=1 Tax=Spiractinospora alimapuensis TaxID=2820884 RepID=UPI001F3C2DD1|nr:hypothetical protein [Spiractinospora alimapuensis]QVQ53799.1 hypothetical protein J4H86_08830 [Spiractinospora alimapuensis]
MEREVPTTDSGSRAATELADAAALWSAGLGSAEAVVEAACASLVAGLDGETLRTLAAVSTQPGATDPGYEVAELLETALAELGISHHPRYSTTANDAALRALCRRHLRGELEPWELTHVAHWMFGHQAGPAEELWELDDVYASLDVTDLTVEDVDAQVSAAARRLVE